MLFEFSALDLQGEPSSFPRVPHYSNVKQIPEKSIHSGCSYGMEAKSYGNVYKEDFNSTRGKRENFRVEVSKYACKKPNKVMRQGHEAHDCGRDRGKHRCPACRAARALG